MKTALLLEKQKGNLEVSMLYTIRFPDVCPHHLYHEKQHITVHVLISYKHAVV